MRLKELRRRRQQRQQWYEQQQPEQGDDAINILEQAEQLLGYTAHIVPIGSNPHLSPSESPPLQLDMIKMWNACVH